jgi:NADH-quinone oxidoreductase subunit J
MSPFLFWLFAFLMLGFGVGVVVNRNPVASALSLVMSFLCLAALFVSLDAFFIGTIQVLVYAGAVMVLFLFIIMLLDLKAEQRRRMNLAAVSGGIFVTFIFVAELWAVLQRLPLGQQTFPRTITFWPAASCFPWGLPGAVAPEYHIFYVSRADAQRCEPLAGGIRRFNVNPPGRSVSGTGVRPFIITVAAAEGRWAIIVAPFRARQTTHVEDINSPKF